MIIDYGNSFVSKEVCRIVAPSVFSHLQVTSHVIPLIRKELQKEYRPIYSDAYYMCFVE